MNSPSGQYYSPFGLFSWLLVLLIGNIVNSASAGQFSIDYANDQFLKDGKPFRYISGGIHYFRVPNQYWEDRLMKMKAAGLNAVEFYIPWNWHEPFEGQYRWTGDQDVFRFLNLTQQLGLSVIARLGPYTCGEWENGGFPYWILKHPNITLRDSNPVYLNEVKKWFDVLLPKLVPYLYKNGGPIIMSQIENEYGSFLACDMDYRIYLRDLVLSYFGNDSVVFTVDGPGDRMLKCGHIPGVYATVDFGAATTAEIKSYFEEQRKYSPKGPLVNTEFYPGWLDQWGKAWQTRETGKIVDSMTAMYHMNASFNFYMFHGGTNFGYMNGASRGAPPVKVVVTSYDYDAPLSEAGDPTPKYDAIKSAIETLTGVTPSIPVPPATPKMEYGLLPVQNLGPVQYLVNILTPDAKRVQSSDPMSFEQLDFPYGFVIYETTVDAMVKNLSIPGLADRAYVIQDNYFVGKLMIYEQTNLTLRRKHTQTLLILVENMGRSNDGSIQRKGILSPVLLDGRPQTGWTMYPIELENIAPAVSQGLSSLNLKGLPRFNSKLFRMHRRLHQDEPFGPSVFYGQFPADPIEDTFFDPSGWGKGVVFINGHNLGRYWPSKGPQVTLFVPKTVLRAVNTVVMLELERPGLCSGPWDCRVKFTDAPFLNKTVTDDGSGALGEDSARFQHKGALEIFKV